MLLSVVGNFLAKFETGGQTSSYVHSFATLLGQQHWEWLRPFARGFSLNRRTKYSGNGGGGGGGGGGRPYFPCGNRHYQKDVILTPLHNINRQNVKANKFILGRLGENQP